MNIHVEIIKHIESHHKPLDLNIDTDYKLIQSHQTTTLNQCVPTAPQTQG